MKATDVQGAGLGGSWPNINEHQRKTCNSQTPATESSSPGEGAPLHCLQNASSKLCRIAAEQPKPKQKLSAQQNGIYIAFHNLPADVFVALLYVALYLCEGF